MTPAEHAHELIVAASPADFERPLYVVAGADLAPDLQASFLSRNVGLSAPFLDLALRGHLESRNEWQGRGAAIVVDQSDIEPFAFVAIHEAAHVLTHDEWTHRVAEDELPCGALLDAVKAACETPRSLDSPPWARHGADFIRAAAHLVWRVRCRAMPRLTLRDVHAAGPAYGLSPSSHYAGALADEVRERRDEPITTILHSEPPALFTELFHRDTFAFAGEALDAD